jgi:hypothetical protein
MLRTFGFILVMSILVVATGCDKKDSHSTDMGANHHSTTNPSGAATQPMKMSIVYTCAMHPEVTSDKPGTCPKCAMALTEKK